MNRKLYRKRLFRKKRRFSFLYLAPVHSFRYNKCNGIPIKTWHYEQSDRELIKIIPFLIFLSTVDDVREYIPKIIDNDEIDYNKIDNILSKMNLNENRNNNLNNN